MNRSCIVEAAHRVRGVVFVVGSLAALFLAMPPAGAVPSEPGLYATFTMAGDETEDREFTARLAYDSAPMTVANFVGLAEGSRAWVDFRKGVARRAPFYDGITFHRVEAQFVIQGGSPNGQGNDGPGYTFRDEFHPSLRHSKAGILSMANSGLHSNGSQFFITLASTPWLDDVHNVFGEVVEGLSVVQSVQESDVIESVVITAVGAAAQAFDVNAHGLPTVADAGPGLIPTSGSFLLDYPLDDDTEYFVFHSGDLKTWQQISGQEIYIDPPSQLSRSVTAQSGGQPRQFFNAARVEYPDPLFTAPTVARHKITLTDPDPVNGLVLELVLPNDSSGNFTMFQDPNPDPVGPFPISSYFYTREAYRGRIQAFMSGLFFGNGSLTRGDFNLVYASATSGTFKGSLINSVGAHYPLSGAFVALPLNP